MNRTREKFNFQKLAPLASLALAGFVFGLFILSLPRQYTTGLSAAKLSLLSLAKSFILPPIKSFGPALALLGLALVRLLYRRTRLTRESLSLLACGLAIVCTFTVLLAAWGPFDSWFYLHTAIPFGWAMIFAALWRPLAPADTAPRGSSLAKLAYCQRTENALLTAVMLFAALITLNGGRNYTSYFSMAKRAADLACEEARRVPGLRIYTNCNEGAVQLREYLLLAGKCAHPPNFEYLDRAPDAPVQSRRPQLLVVSSKCDDFNAPTAKANFVLELDAWKLIKNY